MLQRDKEINWLHVPGLLNICNQASTSLSSIPTWLRLEAPHSWPWCSASHPSAESPSFLRVVARSVVLRCPPCRVSFPLFLALGRRSPVRRGLPAWSGDSLSLALLSPPGPVLIGQCHARCRLCYLAFSGLSFFSRTLVRPPPRPSWTRPSSVCCLE